MKEITISPATGFTLSPHLKLKQSDIAVVMSDNPGKKKGGKGNKGAKAEAAQGNADAKVAVTAPTARKATNTDADNDQEEINPAEYRKNRMNSILEMQAQGFNPYPHKFHVSHRICEFVEQFSGCESNSRLVCRYAFILVTDEYPSFSL